MDWHVAQLTTLNVSWFSDAICVITLGCAQPLTLATVAIDTLYGLGISQTHSTTVVGRELVYEFGFAPLPFFSLFSSNRNRGTCVGFRLKYQNMTGFAYDRKRFSFPLFVFICIYLFRL